jgi:hypothetical protein
MSISVIAADAWPSILCTALMLAPALIASDAAVSLRSWTRSPSGIPDASQAGVHTLRRKLEVRRGPPFGRGEDQFVGTPNDPSRSMTNRGRTITRPHSWRLHPVGRVAGDQVVVDDDLERGV